MNERFVDRTEEMRWLKRFAHSIPEGSDRPAALLEGPSGIGKSKLLVQLEESQGELPVEVFLVRCHPTIGATSALSAVANLYAQIEAWRQARRRRKRAEIGVGVGSALLSLMAEAMPAVKPLLAAGTTAARAAIGSGSMPFDSLAPFEQALDLRVAELLAARLAKQPVLVIVDDLQHCDQRSLFVLEQLLQRPGALRIGMVFSRDPDRIGEYGQLPRMWEREKLLWRRELGGLPAEAVAELVAARLPSAPPSFAEELVRITEGHTIFVTEYLDSCDPARSPATLSFPQTLAELVSEELALLPDGVPNLLITAAAQGYWFDSLTVSEMVGEDAADVRDRLHALAGTSHLIAPAEAPEWAWRARADHYRFHHQALWRLLESRQSPEQHRDLHERIALGAIERFGETATYEQRLEIARHLRAAGEHCLALCSEYHLDLARLAATRYLALSDAEWLCDKAIDAAHAMSARQPDRHRSIVNSAMLYLSLTELRWKGVAQPTGERDSDALAAEAEAASVALGDPVLRARAVMMRGKTLMATAGLAPGLERLKRAVDEARSLPDPTTLYIALIEYGRQASKLSLANGIAQLTAAEDLRRTDPQIRGSADPVLVHARNLGEIQFGISLFDDGQLGRARDRLETAVERLRVEGNRTEMPIALNYLGQLRDCLGEGAAAESVLREAIDLEDERGGRSGWRACNTALLGCVRAQAGASPEEYLALMEQAWEETQQTWLLNLVPIVRNQFAAVLLRADQLTEARRLARDTVEETRETGMVRSEILAHSLLGRIAMARDDRAEALAETDLSVVMLRDRGPMPAVRSEEVWYSAAVIYSKYGRGDEARALHEAAQAELASKARSFPDTASRERFLNAPGLNRSIRGGEGVVS